MSSNFETPAQPEPADYVNDIPDWYSAGANSGSPWPKESRWRCGGADDHWLETNWVRKHLQRAPDTALG